ncbi:MAG: hypothetical protein ACOYYJ_07350 [Chloroflexota bacterium]
MNAEYISLGRLAQSMGVYDSMPVPIQQGLKNSIILTIITSIVCIPIMVFTPNIGYVSSDGFFILFTADAVNFLLQLAHNLSGFLLALNILSLVMILVVLFTSWGMTKPVHESVHWLAWLAAFPSGASAISAAITVALFIAIVVVALIIWAIIIALVLAALSAWASSS